jgi:hypothetical protein
VVRHTHTSQLVNQIWAKIRTDRVKINKSALFDLVVATTNPCKGFGLSDKQNGRTAMYCSLSIAIVMHLLLDELSYQTNHTI